MQHSVLVKMPVGLMDKAGDYRFVISAKDSHADREKGHRQKWALERNQKIITYPMTLYGFTEKNISTLNLGQPTIGYVKRAADVLRKGSTKAKMKWDSLPKQTEPHADSKADVAYTLLQEMKKYGEGVFFFFGHGGPEDYAGKLLVFKGKTAIVADANNPVPSGWTKYAISQIQNLNGVWLVVLAACDSGKLLPNNPAGFENVFMSKGVPHVITLDRVMNPTPVGYWSDLFWKELMIEWITGTGFEVKAAAKRAQKKTLDHFTQTKGGVDFFLRGEPSAFIRYNGKPIEEEN
jgi:hypothetical protein